MSTLKKILKVQPSEEPRWKLLEKIVVEGRETFYAVAMAWDEIREKRYYVDAGYKTFAEYADALDYSPRNLYQRIANARMMNELPPDMRSLILNDAAARALALAPKLLRGAILEIASERGEHSVSADEIKKNTPPPPAIKQLIEGGRKVSADDIKIATTLQLESQPKEEDFYEPFAEWLVESKECSKANPLGGNRLTDKWATPDVVGKIAPRPGDSSHSDIQIAAAEIKVDRFQLVPGFGQACAYRLFAHKSYLVIPDSISQEEKERIDALCQMFSIGLVLESETFSGNVKRPIGVFL